MRSTPPEALPSLVFTARRDDFQIAPSVRRCEELARQPKPPAPPSLQTLGQQGRWGRRFRLPGRPEANFSKLLSAGTGFPAKASPLTLGVIRPPVNMPLEIVCGLPQCT